MINGAHIILYSEDPEADRLFFRDVLRFPSVDVGGGWLIFGLPPSEVAMHPATGARDGNGRHEFHLMCEDVEALMDDLAARGIPCSPLMEERWGSITRVTLPGGGALSVYQPKHKRPKPHAAKRKAKPKAKAAKRARAKRRPLKAARTRARRSRRR